MLPGARRRGVVDAGGRATTTNVSAPEIEGLAAADAMARRVVWTARLERWSDRSLTLLAILLVPLLLIPFLFDLPAAVDATISDVDYVIWALFVVTLGGAAVLSPDRPGYLRRHWLDLLVVVIPLFGPLRAARVIRIVWAAGAAGRVLEGSRRLLAHRGTGFILLGGALVVATAAGLIVSVERDDPSATIRSYGDGIWWAMTTFATVGYGDKYPVTSAGRGIAVALMLLGIAAFGVVTARLAALFVGEQEDEAKTQLLEMDARLRRIENALLRPPSDRSALALLKRRKRNNLTARRVRLRGKRRAARAAGNGNGGDGGGKHHAREAARRESEELTAAR